MTWLMIRIMALNEQTNPFVINKYPYNMLYISNIILISYAIKHKLSNLV